MSALPAADRPDPRSAAVGALTDPALRDIVDLVLWVEDDDGRRVACAASSLGRVRLHPGGVHEVLEGIDPVASEDPMAFLPYDREVAAPGPRSSVDNAYPYAAERILSLFADPTRSPDLAVVHTPRHWFPDEGGHLGEHGSLDVIQSRAPLVLSGAGVRRLGLVDSHARLVDVGPDPRHAGRRRRGRAAGRAGRCAGRCPAHVVPAGRGCPGAAAGGGHPVGRRATAVSCCTWPRRGSCRPCAG